MSHDCCSFEELAGRYQVTSDILFVYQSETLNGMHTKRGLIPMETLETGNSLANLAVHVFKKDGSYEIHLEYRSDVLSGADGAHAAVFDGEGAGGIQGLRLP